MISRTKFITICFLGIHLFILNVTVSKSLPSVIKSEEHEEQIHSCEDWQFECKNGQCVAKPFICDGLKDCLDGSDETHDQCRNQSLSNCDEEHFRCHYGACIEKQYQCDGHQQCIDGSDESPQICNSTDNELDEIRIRRDTEKLCAVLPPSADKTIEYNTCIKNPSSQNCGPTNGYVPELSIATVTCASGYHRDNTENDPEHVCRNSRWLPKIDKCVKICEKLSLKNNQMQCYRKGLSIPNCDENSVLFAGTKVRSSCKSGYRFEYPPTFYETTCGDNGQWDTPLVPCIPECGKPYIKPQQLLYGSRPERVGGSPWHVAIFSKNKQLICGGTIISEHIVISAAHCFSDGNSCEGLDCVDDFEVVVGKYSSDYTVIDNYQKRMQIKEIRFPRKGYYGLATYHAADIAILILKEKIPFGPTILPACLDWISLKTGEYPPDGQLGKVVGWGRTENGTLSTILRTLDLPYISYQRCLDMVADDFKPFVTYDKFCAGTGNRSGPIPLDGDSGGGLLFEEKGLFHLRGVVSVKSYETNAAAVFTDLGQHIDWIASVRDKIEKVSEQTTITPVINVHEETPEPKYPQKEPDQQLTSWKKKLIEDISVEILNDKPVSSLGNEDCLQCTVDIWQQVIKNVWDKLTMVDIFGRVQKNVNNINSRIAFQLAIFADLQKQDKSSWYSQNSITLARHVKSTMEDGLYRTINSEVRSRHEDLKNKLPKSLKNLVFAAQVCIRNRALFGYVFGSSVLWSGYDQNLRYAYNYVPRNADEMKASKWKVRFVDNFKISLWNINYSQPLHAQECGFYPCNGIGRQAFLWNAVNMNEHCDHSNCFWNIEVDGDNILLKNVYLSEYLYADDTSLYTLIGGESKRDYSKWKVYDCSDNTKISLLKED